MARCSFYWLQLESISHQFDGMSFTHDDPSVTEISISINKGISIQPYPRVLFFSGASPFIVMLSYALIFWILPEWSTCMTCK